MVGFGTNGLLAVSCNKWMSERVSVCVRESVCLLVLAQLLNEHVGLVADDK